MRNDLKVDNIRCFRVDLGRDAEVGLVGLFSDDRSAELDGNFHWLQTQSV